MGKKELNSSFTTNTPIDSISEKIYSSTQANLIQDLGGKIEIKEVDRYYQEIFGTTIEEELMKITFKGNKENSDFSAKNCRIFLGKLRQKGKEDSKYLSPYTDDIICEIFYYLFTHTEPGEKICIELGPILSQLMNGEDFEQLGFMQPNEELNHIKTLAKQVDPGRASDVEIYFMDQEHKRLFDTLKQGTEGQRHKELAYVNQETTLFEKKDRGEKIDSLDIAKLLYGLTQQSDAFRVWMQDMAPEGAMNSEDSNWYGFVEIALRLTEFLQGITIQGGVKKQKDYDKKIQFFLSPDTGLPAEFQDSSTEFKNNLEKFRALCSEIQISKQSPDFSPLYVEDKDIEKKSFTLELSDRKKIIEEFKQMVNDPVYNALSNKSQNKWKEKIKKKYTIKSSDGSNIPLYQIYVPQDIQMETFLENRIQRSFFRITPDMRSCGNLHKKDGIFKFPNYPFNPTLAERYHNPISLNYPIDSSEFLTIIIDGEFLAYSLTAQAGSGKSILTKRCEWLMNDWDFCKKNHLLEHYNLCILDRHSIIPTDPVKFASKLEISDKHTNIIICDAVDERSKEQIINLYAIRNFIKQYHIKLLLISRNTNDINLDDLDPDRRQLLKDKDSDYSSYVLHSPQDPVEYIEKYKLYLPSILKQKSYEHLVDQVQQKLGSSFSPLMISMLKSLAGNTNIIHNKNLDKAFIYEQFINLHLDREKNKGNRNYDNAEIIENGRKYVLGDIPPGTFLELHPVLGNLHKSFLDYIGYLGLKDKTDDEMTTCLDKSDNLAVQYLVSYFFNSPKHLAPFLWKIKERFDNNVYNNDEKVKILGIIVQTCEQILGPTVTYDFFREVKVGKEVETSVIQNLEGIHKKRSGQDCRGFSQATYNPVRDPLAFEYLNKFNRFYVMVDHKGEESSWDRFFDAMSTIKKNIIKASNDGEIIQGNLYTDVSKAWELYPASGSESYLSIYEKDEYSSPTKLLINMIFGEDAGNKYLIQLRDELDEHTSKEETEDILRRLHQGLEDMTPIMGGSS